MISYATGDILSSNAYALVNTVNTVGVMGKGVALHFKEHFPYNFEVYRNACKTGQLKTGKMLVVRDTNRTLGDRLIINFPTKAHWRNPSEYSYISTGLADLVKVIRENDIHDIAIPPLGCGNGGLDWETVKKMIVEYLSPLENVNVILFEPGEKYKAQMKSFKANMKLTDARAMLLYALYYFEMFDEHANLVIANKLCYFYQQVGEESFGRMRFSRGHYGPYCHQVEYLLKSVTGKYIHGLEEMDAKPFEDLDLEYGFKQEVSDYVHKMPDAQRRHIREVLNLIDGFESAFSLEILATVSYIMLASPKISFEDVVQEVGKWSERKKRLFKKDYIYAAYNRILNYSEIFRSSSTNLLP